MAVTAGGSPYVEASDLVADYPATSLALANKVDTKLDNAPTDNAQSGATYTFVLGDARNITTATNASAKTFTIPPQSSVTWLTGTMIRVVNYGAGALTVNGGVGVTVTNTATTIAQYGAATAIRTGSNAWTLVPFTGGAGNANFSDTATGTYTSGGINYKYITYNSSGSLTVTTAGLATVLCVGGGGGGGQGGGAGGGVEENTIYLPVATHTIVIGAGGAAYYSGNGSRINSVVGAGGGAGGATGRNGMNGGSGGGGWYNGGTTPGNGIAGQGFIGGATSASAGGGGGGGSAAGSTGVGTTGGAGGAGKTSTITNVSTVFGGGGGGGGNATGGAGGTGGGGAGGSAGNGVAGTANTGGGGGGTYTASGAAGGSGIIIVRVQV